MKTITVNKSNWTGEEAEVKLYSDGRTFAIYGDEKFRIKKMSMFEGDTTWKLYGVTSSGEEYETDHNGWTFKDGSTMFQNWGGDIIRETTGDPREAAAFLMFMLF